MKTLQCLAILFMFISLSFSASSQTTKQNLTGTWRLISSIGHLSEGGWDNDSTMVYQVKTITPSKFMFTIYSPKADTLLMSAQGSITTKGNTYIETIEHCTNSSMTGGIFKYTSSIKGNKWRIEGGNKDMKLVEEWVRVD